MNHYYVYNLVAKSINHLLLHCFSEKNCHGNLALSFIGWFLAHLLPGWLLG